MQAILDVVDHLAHEDIAVLGDGLNQFNQQCAGYIDSLPLAVLVRDPTDQRVLGGLSGRTSLGLLFIDLFFLPGPLRSQGLGSRMLEMAEAEARHRGCRRAVLYTISFQAPDFYARHGWQRFGEIPCDPPGTSRVFMQKELT